MSEKQVEFTVTVTIRYHMAADILKGLYGTTDLARAAEIDRVTFTEAPDFLGKALESRPYTVAVTAQEVQGGAEGRAEGL